MNDRRGDLDKRWHPEAARRHATAVEGNSGGDARSATRSTHDGTAHAEPDHPGGLGGEPLRHEVLEGGVKVGGDLLTRELAHELEQTFGLLRHVERLVLNHRRALAVKERRGDAPVALGSEAIDDLGDVLGQAEGLLDDDDRTSSTARGGGGKRRDLSCRARDRDRLGHVSRRSARRCGCA